MSLLLILSRFHKLCWCFHCWVWTSKYQLWTYLRKSRKGWGATLWMTWLNRSWKLQCSALYLLELPWNEKKNHWNKLYFKKFFHYIQVNGLRHNWLSFLKTCFPPPRNMSWNLLVQSQEWKQRRLWTDFTHWSSISLLTLNN